MELPTYTNIWKIEKRLYKLYDFRLPMPLPVGQIAAFLAIAAPCTIVLTMTGVPFSHTWLWLYLLPPGVLAWLVTRPVVEGKRLPELVLSQLRYLSEPRTWCRMAPLAEKDDIVLTARVWRSARYVRPATESLSAQRVSPAMAVPSRTATARPATARPVPVLPVPVLPAPGLPAPGLPATGQQAMRPARPGQPVRPGQPEPARARATSWPAPPAAPPPLPRVASGVTARAEPAPPVPAQATAMQPAEPAPAQPGPPEPRRPVLRVSGEASAARPLNVVERALRASPGAAGFRDQVVVVPGGHRPGKPDQLQRDQARVRLPLPGPARIVVLGCTSGAGQTITTLLTGQLLASLRGEAVAVLDLGQGQGSLTEQARFIPVLMPSRRAGADPGQPGHSGERGLQVVTAGDSADDPGQIISAVAARYPLTLADPAAGCVPRTLRAADQLILVAPATAEAPGSLAMTIEWLEAHDHGALAARAITVLNGVSPQAAGHAEKAAAVASGRSRAIVRIPWDEHVRGRQQLGTATIHAYTALAGVLIAGLADVAAGAGTGR